MAFKPFDPDGETSITRQTLRHWRQMGVTYFVTSRLADSLPVSVIKEWEEERLQWLSRHGIRSVAALRSLSSAKQREFKRLFIGKWHQRLDVGHGACLLREPTVADILVEELVARHSFDYGMDAWVIMPNHFHVLVSPTKTRSLSSIQQRWKGGSAKRINQLLNRHGTLWQKEAFDHIVRNSRRLNDFRRYIAENPRKARLSEGEYILGFRQDQITPTKLLEICSRNFSP